MTDPTLIAEIAEIVRGNIELAPDVAIDAGTRFADDLGADSFGMLCIVHAVREQYGIPEDPDITAIASLADLASYVARRRPPPPRAA